MVRAENGQGLARHVDSSPHERTVAFWDLDRRCGELKCGILVRDAEKHGNEGSHRLVAKRPLPRQLIAQRFTTAGSQIVGLSSAWRIQTWQQRGRGYRRPHLLEADTVAYSGDDKQTVFRVLESFVLSHFCGLACRMFRLARPAGSRFGRKHRDCRICYGFGLEGYRFGVSWCGITNKVLVATGTIVAEWSGE